QGSPPGFVGSTVRVNGRSYTIVGVGRAGFSGLHAIISPDLWLPLGAASRLAGMDPSESRPGRLDGPGAHAFNLIARLRPGLTLDAAKGRLALLGAWLSDEVPTQPGRQRDLQI